MGTDRCTRVLRGLAALWRALRSLAARPLGLRGLAAGLPVLLLGLLAGCADSSADDSHLYRGSSARPERPQGVLVIAVDGLRADRIGAAGYDRATTPRLDELLEEGVLFDSMIASAPMPVPAHIALLTGCDPNVARGSFRTEVDPDQNASWRVPLGVPRLAMEFALFGFRTLALADGDSMGPLHGIGPGFQDFERPYTDLENGERRGIERSTARLAQWVRSLDDGDSWFAYVHSADLLRCFDEPDPRWSTLFDPRDELDWVPPVAAREPALFALPPSRWSGGMQPMSEYDLRYDGAIARIDAAIGACCELLRDAGRLEQTTIAVVGTFGLQFGEAGLLADHGRLSIADLRVPLALVPAAELESRRGARIECLASHIDLAPTLLDLAGLDGRAMQGVSLWPVARGAAATARPYTLSSGGLQGGFAVFSEELVLEELFGGDTAPGLVRGWFGDLDEHPNTVVRRIYRWRTDSFPPLVNGYVTDPSPAPGEVEDLRLARTHWGAAVQALRERPAAGL